MPKTIRVPAGMRRMGKVQKTRLGIIFGGRSGEHEISLKSAASVISALDPDEFEVTVIGITKSGKFAGATEIRSMLPSHLIDRVRHSPILAANNSETASQSDLPDEPGNPCVAPEIFFPLLHGPYGEDGTIQGLLEIANLPYVGCGVLASAVGMDKDVMKRLFLQTGLPVAPYRTVFSADIEKDPGALKRSVSAEFGYPLFSKPANLGSSVGICKIRSEKEFDHCIKHSAQFDRKVLIEKGLAARELECAILGNDDPQASVVGEIIPSHDFYDYDAKYKSPDSRLEIPARLDDAKMTEIRNLALQSFKAIDGSGLSRVDFFLEKESGKVWINEINTMPGFTPISMYAKLWDASGVSFEQLVRRLIVLGRERYREKNERRISEI
jgi:D-alanine-D-alanine ligase